jgi:hypothetical protein
LFKVQWFSGYVNQLHTEIQYQLTIS